MNLAHRIERNGDESRMRGDFIACLDELRDAARTGKLSREAMACIAPALYGPVKLVRAIVGRKPAVATDHIRVRDGGDDVVIDCTICRSERRVQPGDDVARHARTFRAAHPHDQSAIEIEAA